ncbi:MAG: phosphatase PAP2 family protein [Verrucomicrobiota bacterium]
MKFIIRSFVFLRAACFATLLLTATPLFAAGGAKSQALESDQPGHLNYLAAGTPAAAALLPPPPLSGSSEQAADMDEVRAVYHAASDVDKKAAHAEKRFSIFNFTGSVGSFFVETKLPKTAAFFEMVQKDAESVCNAGKEYFQRPRPYTIDPALANGKLETSFSYPSGHSTESMTIALVLAELMPEKRETIMAHARLIGWHRVQIARHYPTDIYAGRVLAQAIVGEMKKNADFQKDMAAVKDEIATLAHVPAVHYKSRQLVEQAAK